MCAANLGHRCNCHVSHVHRLFAVSAVNAVLPASGCLIDLDEAALYADPWCAAPSCCPCNADGSDQTRDERLDWWLWRRETSAVRDSRHLMDLPRCTGRRMSELQRVKWR